MITTRSGKGTPLTHPELDSNFEDLDTRTAEGWRDNVIEMTTRGGVTEPPRALFRDNIYLLQFSHLDLMEVYGNFHIDHDYKLGTAIYPHVHWTTNTTDTGTVRWGFEYTVAKGHQQASFPATTTVYVEQASTGTAYMHYVSEVSTGDAISGVNIEPDTFILMRVFRDTGHANDTFPAAVYGIALDLHYQADRATTPNKAPNFYGV